MLYWQCKGSSSTNTLRKSLQTTSASPCRTQVQPTASFLVCSLIFIEYKIDRLDKKRTKQNSKFQITRFVRFLYLRLDFCPSLFQLIQICNNRCDMFDISQHTTHFKVSQYRESKTLTILLGCQTVLVIKVTIS